VASDEIHSPEAKALLGTIGTEGGADVLALGSLQRQLATFEPIVPRTFAFVRLPLYATVTFALQMHPRALLQAALAVISLDPHDALNVFPVTQQPQPGQWIEYVLTFPTQFPGELRYEIDDTDRLIVLRNMTLR
jgi:hypothetical protein